MINFNHGDVLETLREMPDNEYTAVFCDPPYGLSKPPDMMEVLTHWLAGDDYVHTGGGDCLSLGFLNCAIGGAMAGEAERNQIEQSVGIFVVTKEAIGLDVMDVKRLSKFLNRFVAVHAAMLARIAVPLQCFSSLGLPIGSALFRGRPVGVHGVVLASSMYISALARAVLSAARSIHPALIPIKRCVAIGAGHFDLPGPGLALGGSVLAFRRAVLAASMCCSARHKIERLSAEIASARYSSYSCIIPAIGRAILPSLEMRWLAGESLPTLYTNLGSVHIEIIA